MANSYFNENTLEELIEEIKYVYKSDDRPWVIGYSGGKDSTTVVELVYKMLLGLDPEDRHKNVYIVSSDTLIENPLIKIYLSKMNDLLGQAADRDGLPIKSAMVTPPPNNSFWANVIGRGFPTPRMNGTFRWCTDRLKINPSGEYIQRVIDEEGKEVVVLLGVRKAESIARKRRIEGRELANRLLNRHETIQDAYVYNPIVELTTDDVWDVLLRCDGGRTPWGSDNSELVSLYADADSGECPFAGIHAGGQTQSCGNSRFGCWVCTVVKEDKSLNGFIKSGHRELIPLAEFRSIARKRRIEGRELANRLLNRHETIQDAYVYNPIVELTTDDVWDVLLRCDGGRTPWGSDNSELVSLYADADSGECPFAGIHAGGQTQSCGNSRFGCWVCTVVKEDKSLNGFIKSGHRELIPLAEFRSWLMSIRDNEEYREKKRRNGTVYRDKQGNMGFGPFNWKARKLILRKLLETQQVMGYELITLDELKAIDEIWDQELDLSRRVLVELYEKITGKRLPWYDYKEPLIDNETVVELENLAQKNNVPEELIRNLLLSVY